MASFNALLVAAVLLLIVLTNSVAAARCQVSSISYDYPHQALRAQQIQINTNVVGSCISNGADYYSVRVDLVDKATGSTISSVNAPIGYKASNFTVTAKNTVTTPTKNMTWSLRANVYVIRAGGTSGLYLFDYTKIGNVTIQVGGTVLAMPEFQTSPESLLIVSFSAATLLLTRRKLSGTID